MPLGFQTASRRIRCSTCCLVLLPSSIFGTRSHPLIKFLAGPTHEPSAFGIDMPGFRLCAFCASSFCFCFFSRSFAAVAFAFSRSAKPKNGSASYIHALPSFSSVFLSSWNFPFHKSLYTGGSIMCRFFALATRNRAYAAAKLRASTAVG